MKFVFSIILSVIFTTAVSERVIRQIDGITGYAEVIEFDSDGNVYVATHDDENHQLYKLNSAKELLWTANITDLVLKIVISSQNAVYIEFRTEDLENYITILREETLTIEKIEDMYGGSIFIDESDNIIYNSNDGVKLLKPNSTTPIIIKNLEGYFFLDVNFAVDSKGNINLGVSKFGSSNISFAILTKESKQGEVPEATHYYYLDSSYYFDYLVLDQNDDAWIFTTNLFAVSQIIKFSNGTLTKILSDSLNEKHRAKAIKDRVYVVSITFNYEAAPTYFFTLNGEAHEIRDFDDVSQYSSFSTDIVADKDGNAYIGSYYAFKNGPIALMKPNEENPVWITGFPSRINVFNMIPDENDDLWITTAGQGVYYLEKGRTYVLEVSTHGGIGVGTLTGDVNINKKTNEVFLLGLNGLYFISHETL